MKTYKFNLNTRNFGRIGSTIEFYDKIGVNFRNKNYANFRINPKSGKQVQRVLIQTHRNYDYRIEETWKGLKVRLSSPTYKPFYAERRARFDWANYSPVDDESLPMGVVVEYEPGDKDYKELVVLPKR